MVDDTERAVLFFPGVAFSFYVEVTFIFCQKSQVEQVLIAKAVGAVLKVLGGGLLLLNGKRHFEVLHRCCFRHDALENARPLSMLPVCAINTGGDLFYL